MRLVLQRVRSASVKVGGREVAAIGPGMLAMVGFSAGETPAPTWARIAERLVTLRIFDDESGRLNRSLADVHGELLIVPQITLTARLDKGTRPTFHTAAAPEAARGLFDAFVAEVGKLHPNVKTGLFQAEMVVGLENDGPITFVLDG